MNLLKPLLVAAAALAASQVQALPLDTYSFSFGAVPAGAYAAPAFTDGVKASTQTTSLSGVYLQPQGVTGSYLVVSNQGGTPAGSATIDTGDVKSYSFVWGSPDTFNSIAIYGNNGFATSFSGVDLQSQFGLQANGNNAETGLFTITGNGDSVIDHLVLKSQGVAFEIAAPVPEPETYALMLAGLGALGFMARNRRRA